MQPNPRQSAQLRQLLSGMHDGTMAGTILYPVWIINDALQLNAFSGAVEERSAAISALVMCFVIRSIVVTTCLVYLYVSSKLESQDYWLRRLTWMGALTHQMIGMGIVGLTWLVGGPSTNYYSGLILVVIGITLFVPRPWHHTAAHVGTLCLSYVLMTAAWLMLSKESGFQIWSNLLFLVGAAAVCVGGVWASQRRSVLPGSSHDRRQHEERGSVVADDQQHLSFDAALCYQSEDWKEVERVAILLRESGVRVWFDRWFGDFDLTPVARLKLALERSRCLVIFIGRTGTRKWDDGEAGAALRSLASVNEVRAIPVALGAASMETNPRQDTCFGSRQWIRVSDVPRQEEVFELEVAVSGHDFHPGGG